MTGGPQDAPTSGERPRLEVQDLVKTFSGVAVLQDFDLVIPRGEIHALVGQNGSGKSTLIKILSGYHRPDRGQVHLDGNLLPFGDSAAAYSLGCRFVHQDLGLVDSCSIADNLALNTFFPSQWGTVRDRELHRRARDDLARVGLDVDPKALVGSLSPALRTGVAVARALREEGQVQPRVLVLDEPTANFPAPEVDALLNTIRSVASAGVTVLFVTHRLDEVFDVAERLTVIRDGRRVATSAVADVERRQVVNWLVGRDVAEATRSSSVGVAYDKGCDWFLEMSDVSVGPIERASLGVRRGEILGLAGVTGSGRERLLGAIFGGERLQGRVTMAGQAVPPSRPDLSMEAGMAYLPADRKLQGGIMDFSATENISLSNLGPFWRRWHLNERAEEAEAAGWFERLEVRPAAPKRPLFEFSGGNQQKVLLAKWFRRQPLALLMDEPTQGVDVGAKVEIHRQITSAAEGGAAVLVSSSDVDELVTLCDRVAILVNGRVAGELSGSDLSIRGVTEMALGLHDGAPS